MVPLLLVDLRGVVCGDGAAAPPELLVDGAVRVLGVVVVPVELPGAVVAGGVVPTWPSVGVVDGDGVGVVLATFPLSWGTVRAGGGPGTSSAATLPLPPQPVIASGLNTPNSNKTRFFFIIAPLEVRELSFAARSGGSR